MLPSSAASWVDGCREDTARLCFERRTAQGLGATDMTCKEGNPKVDSMEKKKNPNEDGKTLGQVLKEESPSLET